MLETRLRPKTLDQLRVPEHYTKGASVLRVTADIDKNEFARDLPLTDAARAALDSMCPREGLIFGKHDYRPQLSKAAVEVLPPHLAGTFTAYDLRHRCATELAWGATDDSLIYLAAAGLRGARANKQDESNPAQWRSHKQGSTIDSCEGEDSNLHGSYPASTSSDCNRSGASHFSDLEGIETPREAPQGTSVGAVPQALSILTRAALGEVIARDDGLKLARAVLSFSELGRRCLAVLDDGSARALVELAAEVCRSAKAGDPSI